MFFGRNDAKAETPILWPPHVKSWLIGKDSDAGRDWGQEEEGTTEDEMAGWHHWLNRREIEWIPGDGDGQGGLACCDSWGRKESDTTERLKCTLTTLRTVSCDCYLYLRFPQKWQWDQELHASGVFGRWSQEVLVENCKRGTEKGRKLIEGAFLSSCHCGQPWFDGDISSMPLHMAFQMTGKRRYLLDTGVILLSQKCHYRV